jgi:hypothetical protein
MYNAALSGWNKKFVIYIQKINRFIFLIMLSYLKIPDTTQITKSKI